LWLHLVGFTTAIYAPLSEQMYCVPE